MNKYQRVALIAEKVIDRHAIGVKHQINDMDSLFEVVREFDNTGFDALFAMAHVSHLLSELRVKIDPNQMKHFDDFNERFSACWMADREDYNAWRAQMKEVLTLRELNAETMDYNKAVMIAKLTYGGEQ